MTRHRRLVRGERDDPGLYHEFRDGVLVLHRNEVVSADRLIDELWGESQPASAVRTLQAYVSRLRKTLAANRAVSVAADDDPGGRLC